LPPAGEIDILVNNAGIGVGGPVEQVPLSHAQAMFETNVWGPARMVQALAPGMPRRSRGAIVNVTSLAGRAVAPLQGYYAASKWALEALSEAMDSELRHWGYPRDRDRAGFIDTPMLQKENDFEMPAAPYDELRRIWDAASAKLSGDGALPGPELVAGAIADALEEDPARAASPGGCRRRDGRRRARFDELRAVHLDDARDARDRLVV
jgi:NAD(P)-dependent dehydrogenase (short-subunit alcohol dehydrogenase family)